MEYPYTFAESFGEITFHDKDFSRNSIIDLPLQTSSWLLYSTAYLHIFIK